MCKKISVKKLSPHSLKKFSVKKFEISVDHLSLQIKICKLSHIVIEFRIHTVSCYSEQTFNFVTIFCKLFPAN